MPLPIGTNVKNGLWHAHHICKNCKGEMTEHQRKWSFGVCPYCAYCDGSTVCDTDTVAMKWVPVERAWWQLWKTFGGEFVRQKEAPGPK